MYLPLLFIGGKFSKSNQLKFALISSVLFASSLRFAMQLMLRNQQFCLVIKSDTLQTIPNMIFDAPECIYHYYLLVENSAKSNHQQFAHRQPSTSLQIGGGIGIKLDLFSAFVTGLAGDTTDGFRMAPDLALPSKSKRHYLQRTTPLCTLRGVYNYNDSCCPF